MKKLTAVVLSAAAALSCTGYSDAFSSSAAELLTGYKGDLNNDMKVNSADLVILTSHILNNAPLAAEFADRADVNDDSLVDIFDCTYLRQFVTGQRELIGIYTQIDEPFIEPSIRYMQSSMPSQGNAEAVVFYVDFPDCRHSYSPSADTLSNIIFGDEDESNPNYPYESISAFYKRSSKGALNFEGQVFCYTAQHNISYYQDDRALLPAECLKAFDSTVDFSQFDGNGDRRIDAMLVSVPETADSTYWWPCAGPEESARAYADNTLMSHVVVGNVAVSSETDYIDFTSSYLHEFTHCMGIPDYYLYDVDDYNGMHGTAGCELMDAEACSDLCAQSKLFLGWYRQDQVEYYYKQMGTKTYTLNNAQTDSGNCLVIPALGYDSGSLFNEFFILEYSSLDRNNSNINNVSWWQRTGSGVRVLHAEATYQKEWWAYFRYSNGYDFNDNYNGRRFIRIIDDTDTDNFYHAGDVIDNRISGFNWYDSKDRMTIDPGITITVDSFGNDAYTVTVSPK